MYPSICHIYLGIHTQLSISELDDDMDFDAGQG
jgi:hypothetical protein